MRKNLLYGAAGLVIGGALAFGIPASADVPHPTPTATAVTPTPTPTPTVTPVINPFAGCSFSFSRVSTFDPVRGRFVVEFVPAIVCDRGPFRFRPEVFDLVR